MRTRLFLTVATLLTLAFAGCLDTDDTAGTDGVGVSGNADGSVDTGGGAEDDRPAGETTSKDQEEVSENRTPYMFPEDYPEFCEDEETATEYDGECTFYDDLFHEYILYDLDTTQLDIIIVPPASAENQRDTVTLRLAVEAWRDGIEELGEPWFVQAFDMHIYVAGEDDIPQEVLEDTEIYVIAAEFNPAVLFGIGLESPYDPCRERGGAVREYADHSHHGMTIVAEECEEGGFTCAAINTNFLLGGERRMYDLVSHEVGHCLGTGHVGDALDFSAKRIPLQDIMSYRYDPEQVHCVSNLNVRTFEGIYGGLIDGRPDDAVELLTAGDFVHMHPGDYGHVECANPDVDSLIGAQE